jgi:hypothetical protein
MRWTVSLIGAMTSSWRGVPANGAELVQMREVARGGQRGVGAGAFQVARVGEPAVVEFTAESAQSVRSTDETLPAARILSFKALKTTAGSSPYW